MPGFDDFLDPRFAPTPDDILPLPSRPLGGYGLPPNITDNDPLGGYGGNSNTTGGGSGGGLGGLLKKLFGGNSNDAATLGALIAALMSGRGSSPEFSPEVQAGMSEAIGMTNARTRRTDPLHQAVTQLAFAGLPIASRQGIQLSQVPLPSGTAASAAPVAPPPQPGDGTRTGIRPRAGAPLQY